jgi:TatD DNase family protein
MDFLDIHTHDAGRENAILNCSTYTAGRSISVGIHPWEISEGWERQFMEIERMAAESNVVAIGECGIDKLKGPSLDLQMALFKKEALLAESRSIPLVIHCVKAFNELILLKKEIKPLQPWIIHGFRGKLSLATDCIRHGFYLSIGAYFQEDALKAIPTDKLFIETDESDKPIEDIYQNIAQVRAMELEELRECINKNAREVFFKS